MLLRQLLKFSVPANAVPVSSGSLDGFEPQEARCHDRDVTTEHQEPVLLELTSPRNSGTNSGTQCTSDTGQVPMRSRPGRALSRSFPDGSRLSPRVRLRLAPRRQLLHNGARRLVEF